MEPQYSVLLFSKYSSNCKKIFDLISSSGLDILDNHLQLLCVDNESIRQRIKQNNQIDVATVPCILSIFSNGKVEKYDGSYAFSFVETLISRLQPPPPPTPPPPQQLLQKRPPQSHQQKLPQRPPQKPQKTSINDIIYEEEQDGQPIVQEQDRQEDRQEIEEQEIEEQEIETEDDRNITRPPPRRIRQDENTYIEDENLFSGEAVDNRKQPKNTTKGKADRKIVESNGIKAKADELAKLRELDDKQLNNQSRRPIADRRP